MPKKPRGTLENGMPTQGSPKLKFLLSFYSIFLKIEIWNVSSSLAQGEKSTTLGKAYEIKGW
jgi:hypothetical protein